MEVSEALEKGVCLSTGQPTTHSTTEEPVSSNNVTEPTHKAEQEAAVALEEEMIHDADVTRLQGLPLPDPCLISEERTERGSPDRPHRSPVESPERQQTSPDRIQEVQERSQKSPNRSELVPVSQEQLDFFISPSQRLEAEELLVSHDVLAEDVTLGDRELDWTKNDDSHARKQWEQQGLLRQADWARGGSLTETSSQSGNSMKLLQQAAQWASRSLPQHRDTQILGTSMPPANVQPLPFEHYGRPDPQPSSMGTVTEGCRGTGGGQPLDRPQAESITYTTVHPEDSLLDIAPEDGLDHPAIVLEPYSCSGEEGGRKEHEGGVAMEDGGGEAMEDGGGEAMEDGGGEAMEEGGGEAMEEGGGEAMQDGGEEAMNDVGGEVDKGRGSRGEERLGREETGRQELEEGGVISGGSSESVRHISETPVNSEEAQSHDHTEPVITGSNHDQEGALMASELVRCVSEASGGVSTAARETNALPVANTSVGYPFSTNSDARFDSSGRPTNPTADARVDSNHHADLGESTRPICLTDSDATVATDPPDSSAAGSAGPTQSPSQSTCYVDVTGISSQDDIITVGGELCNVRLLQIGE